MEGMRQFPDKYFDLAIVDPPYGIGESGKKNGTRSKLATSKDYPEFYGKDKEPPGPEYFAELFRVSKNQVVWGANHFISRIRLDNVQPNHLLAVLIVIPQKFFCTGINPVFRRNLRVKIKRKRFNAFGLPDYRLRNVTDLKVVFGHDVKLLKGYSDLTAEQRKN